MQVMIIGHGIDVSDSLREYVEEKCTRLERHFPKLSKVHVILNRLSSSAEKYQAEITLHAPRDIDCVAQSTDADLRAAIDTVIDKIDRQLTRAKEKIQDKRHR